jgi:quinoprotein glucose dehydrogenase
MPQSKFLVAAAPLALSAFLLAPQAMAQGTAPYGQPSIAKGDWPMYFADLSGSRYAPQDQIDASNFNKLEVAWHFKTDNFGARPEYKLEGTPLEINGTVYTTAGSRRAVVALDAKTGELKWVYSLNEGLRAAISPRQLSGRGVSYWTDGKGDDRIIFITMGFRLVELNAHTGQPIESFGDHGLVDMRDGFYIGVPGHPGVYKQIDPVTGEIGLHSTPTVVDNLILVGSSMREGTQPLTMNNTKGLTRAFDVKTGKIVWTFHNIPQKGEFGYDTWANNSADWNGNTGTWASITVDQDLNTAYLPIEEPTNDSYGGTRPGNNLFGDSLVAVDLHTGKMKWYFQVVHHPVFNFDMSSPPLLVDAVVDGKPVKEVAEPNKTGWLYVFDRVTGKPVWPMPERPVPQSDVPGEQMAKTQPFPTKPAPYARQFVNSYDDLIDYTPELHQKAVELVKKNYKLGPMFAPAILSKLDGFSALYSGTGGTGGTNWPGGGFDPETQTVFLPGNDAAQSFKSLVVPPEGLTDEPYEQGTAGQVFTVGNGPGFGAASDAPKVSVEGQKLAAVLAAHPQHAVGPPPPRNVDGLPLIKPPYGTLTAVNMNTGDFRWHIAAGDTPDEIRNNPALRGIDIPKTGQTGNVGLMVTKTMVVQGDPQYSTPPGHPRGAILHAYDKMTGAEVGRVWMPAPQTGSPMTYNYDGKQYIIVAVSGGNYSGDYIAYALPNN